MRVSALQNAQLQSNLTDENGLLESNCNVSGLFNHSSSMQTNEIHPIRPPSHSNSWIKCQCLRDGLGLHLSRIELGFNGTYSLEKRTDLINNIPKLLSFLDRAERTVKNTKNENKKNRLISWAETFLQQYSEMLSSEGSKGIKVIQLLITIRDLKSQTEILNVRQEALPPYCRSSFSDSLQRTPYLEGTSSTAF